MKRTATKKVLIVGAGATGLAAAYELQKRGIKVIVVEKAEELGGLAGSLTVYGTHLERFYHHLFASDTAAIDLIRELGMQDKLIYYPSNNAIYYNGVIYPFSTPVDMLLKFSPVNLVGRFRFAFSSAYLKFTNNWRPLEKQLALEWMKRWAGRRATEVIWEPLIRGKFGDRAKDIPMSWLWARIHYRTFKLGYMNGGFQQIYEVLAGKIKQAGGEIVMGQGINSLQSVGKGVRAVLEDGRVITADMALATVAEPLFAKMTGSTYNASQSQGHLGATCFTLELKQSLISYYWLNINDLNFPFLAVVEHTKLMGTKPYGGKHIVYIGNYVPHDDWRFTTDPKQLLKKYLPYIQKLNPDFREDWIANWYFSKAPYTQPILTREYASQILPNKTELPNIWLANMSQIYPQDRGQNYAFAMAKKVVKDMLGEV